MRRIRAGVVTRWIGVLLLSGCVAPPPGELLLTLRWPEPPETTRIEYVDVIRGSQDVAEAPGFRYRLARFIGLEGVRSSRPIVHPADVEVTADGRIVYVSDFAQGIVHVFDLDLSAVHHFGLSSRFARPFGLALDGSGNLYLVEQEKRQVRQIDPTGRTLRIIASPNLIRPTDIAVDEQRNRIYVADPSHQDSKEHFVRVFDLEGNYLGEIGEGRGSSEGQLLFPTYLALDAEGNLYVSDTMNSRISVFDAEHRFVRTIGARGDGFGLFDKPKGVALDSFGNLYVVDSSWSNVQIFGPEGHVLLYFGGRGGYPGLLRNPTGIAIARSTNEIFVADYLNRRLCIYRLVNTTAGEGIPDRSGAEDEPQP